MSKETQDIKAVHTPLTFAKENFANWLEAKKDVIPKFVSFGTDFSLKLPDKVELPEIKKCLFYYEDETYCYSISEIGKKKIPYVIISKIANGIPYKIDLQLLISNNRTEEKPIATICIVFKLKDGKLSKPILLDSRAKSKPSDFIQAVNRTNNRLLLNLNDETFLLLKEKINQQKTETTLVFKNAGNVRYKDFNGRLYENCYVDKDGTIVANEDGIVCINGQTIKLDDSYKDRLPKMFLENIDVKNLLKAFMIQAEQVYKNRLDVFLGLGASLMTIFIDDIWEKRAGFPIIYLYGATKQGKSILQGIISNFFGFSNKNVSMGNSTDNAIAMKCHRANAIPVLINDFDFYKAQGNAFENNIVQFYEGGIREKMYDGSVMNRMPINTTAIFSSNYCPCDKPKVYNRLLPIYFPNGGIATEFIDDKFVNNTARSKIVEELMKFDKETIFNKINEVEEWLIKSQFLSAKDRESNNIAIAYTGLLLLESLSGYILSDKDIKLKDYCSWYANLFAEENSPVERFLKSLPTLLNKSKLKKGIHFHTDIKGKQFLFTFDFANTIIIYNDVMLEGDVQKYIDKKTFGEELATSKYFVERKNHRFNNTKGQAYAYTLDLASSNVMTYLFSHWGMSFDDFKILLGQE